MSIVIQEGDIRLANLRTRMPFKYGIATMTRMPMLFLRLRVEIDGAVRVGVSSDLLPPRWFTKDPNQTVREEIEAMLRAIQGALESAAGLRGPDAFTVWRLLYELREQFAEVEDTPRLLMHFGTSLVERALIEAVCKARGKSFHRALLDDDFRVRPGDIHEGLGGVSLGDALPAAPAETVLARHTVGLADALTDDEIPASERVSDGLPQSLTACVEAYGLRHFKIKVSGDPEGDLERLRRIAGILAAKAAPDHACTLDGNEQFKTMGEFRKFWSLLQDTEELRDFLKRIVFVEQPVHRDEALKPSVGGEFGDWTDAPPVIIDESDGNLESLPAALSLGYAGTSHKNCKGVFKSVINRCLLHARSAKRPGMPAVMSGEDLCNIGPVALLQDLAVAAALGIESVERNGHHYCAGLSMFPEATQKPVLESHRDLYRQTEAGWPAVRIQDGRCRIGSINRAPLGVGFTLDLEPFTPAAQWEPDVED